MHHQIKEWGAYYNMKRLEMKIEVSRFKDGKLKVIVRHEESSYFWKSDLTECPRFENVKHILEVLMMVDWWNKEHHKEFELLWDSLFVKTTRELNR